MQVPVLRLFLFFVLCNCSSLSFAQKDENGHKQEKPPNNLCESGNRIVNEVPVLKSRCGGTGSENSSHCFLHLNTMCTCQNDETVYKIICIDVNVCSTTQFKNDKEKLLAERKQKAMLPVNIVLTLF